VKVLIQKRSSQTPWLSAFANFLNSIILFRGVNIQPNQCGVKFVRMRDDNVSQATINQKIVVHEIRCGSKLGQKTS